MDLVDEISIQELGYPRTGQIYLTKSLKLMDDMRMSSPARPSSMAEHPAVVIAPWGSGNQTMSRHRRVAGSTPAGGTMF